VTLTYLSGVVVPSILDQPRDDLGLLLTPDMGNKPDLHRVRAWGADNGCYGNPYWFDEDRFLGWLDRLAPYAGNCAFASVPDVPCDWDSTTANYSMVQPIRERGFPPALVLQDGMDPDDVPWYLFDAAFIGGSDQFKLVDAEPVVARARAEGLWIHMGRVNSLKRMQLAQRWGCDSVDGTYLNYGRRVNKVPENLPRLRRFLDTVNGRSPRADGITCQGCAERLDHLSATEQRPADLYDVGALSQKREGHQIQFVYANRRHQPVRLCELVQKERRAS